MNSEAFTVHLGFPRFEGANIGTWIGFKHLFYLAEEAVIAWFRAQSLGPQRLYHAYGLGLAVIDASGQFVTAVEIDDDVTAVVRVLMPGRFNVRLLAERDGRMVTLFRGRLSAVLVREDGTARLPGPGARFEAITVDGIGDDARADRLPGVQVDRAHPEFRWSWQARYFHCRHSRQVQHSAYVRALEETVERFLAARGISVGRMLAEQGLIPVVSRGRISLVGDAFMEETIETEFKVTTMMRNMAYEASMACFVRRGEVLHPAATADIVHAYAHVCGPKAGRVAELDPATVTALAGH